MLGFRFQTGMPQRWVSDAFLVESTAGRLRLCPQGRYQVLRPTVFKTENIHRYIDSTTTVLQEARVRNFTRWPVIGQNSGRIST